MANELTDIRLVIEVVANSAPLDKVYASMQKVNQATMVGQKMQSNAAKNVSAASRGWAAFSEKLAVTERKMDAVFRAGVHLQAMGRDLTGAGKSLLGFAVDVVTRYGEYDFILRQTSVALNTNEEWQRKLNKAIQATAITLGKYKPEEVAEAYRLWGAATGDVVDSQESLARITQTVEKILIATGMAGGTVESNIKGIYGVLKQYNLDMDQAGHVTEVLAVLTERTAANFGDLTGAFVYTGSAIGNVGGTFEDTAQVLGILADAGYRGTKAGRGLSMVFEAFLSPATKKAEKALNALAKRASGGKKNWEDLITPIKNGKRHFIGIRDTVTNLAKAMKDMGPIERQQAINAIFTNNAARAMLPTIQSQIVLWEQQAKAGKKLTSVFDEQKYSLKTASTFFANMTDQFKGSIQSLIGSFQNSLFPILEMLAGEIMKIAGPILKFLTDKMKVLTTFLDKNPALVELVVKFGAIAAVILVVVGSFFTLLGTIALFMSNIFLVGAALMPLVTVIAALIAGIVGLGVAFANNTQGIRTAFFDLTRAVQRFFDILTGGDKGRGQIIKDITDALRELATIALGQIVKWMEQLTIWLDSRSPEDIANIRELAIQIGKVVGAFLAFKAACAGVELAFGIIKTGVMFLIGPFTSIIGLIFSFQGALRGIIALLPLVGVAAGPISWIIMGIVAAIAAFVVAYQTNFMGFKDFVDGIIAWVVTNVVPVLTGIAETVGGVISTIVTNVTGFINDVLIPAAQQFIDWVVKTFGPLLEQVGKTVGAIGEFIGALVEIFQQATVDIDLGFMKPIGDLLNWLVGFFAANFGALLNIVSKFVEGVVQFITGLFRIVQGIFEVFTAALKGDWSKFFQGLGNIVGGFVDTIVAFWSTLWNLVTTAVKEGLGVIDRIFTGIFGEGPDSIYGHIKGFIQTLIKFGGDVLGGFVKGVGDAVGGAVKQVTGFIGSIVDGVKGFLGINSPSTLFASFGKNIVQGLWNGIVGLKDWIIDKVMAFVKDILPGPIKDVLGIHSPSKMMAGLGVNIVEGLAQGIANTEAQAVAAMQSVANSVADVATGAVGSMNFDAGGQFNMSNTMDATRHIELSVDVTSGDGSVDQLDMNTLADLITGSSMVRALERMGATD